MGIMNSSAVPLFFVQAMRIEPSFLTMQTFIKTSQTDKVARILCVFINLNFVLLRIYLNDIPTSPSSSTTAQ